MLAPRIPGATARPLPVRGTARRSGTTIPEAALVIAVFLLLMFGIFEYARFVMVRQLLENAAREGGRFAVVHTHDKVTADVQAVVRQRLGGQEKQLEGFDPATDIQVFKASPADPTVPASNPDWKTANFGDAITVQISGTYKPNLPTFLFLPAEVPLLVRTVMFSEDTPLTR